MSEADRARFAAVGGYRQFDKNAPLADPDRRRWLVKILQLAYEDDRAPGQRWPALVPLAIEYGGRAAAEPVLAEFEAVKGLTVGELFGCPRKRASRAVAPWTDELNRLRYIAGKLDDMLTEWEGTAEALAGNASGREGPEGRAQGRELARCAEEVRGILGASLPPGSPPPPGAWDWLDWHLAEAARLVREARP